MSELRVVQNGAVLVRDGVIEEAGTSRRIENLAPARRAAEIDAAGRIVMPAFADVDVELVAPPVRADRNPEDGSAIRLISGRNALSRAAAMASERARYGCLTVGATTSCSADLRSTVKILRAHRALQSKPLRIRSVYSYRAATPLEELSGRWLPAMRRERLGSVVELSATADGGSAGIKQLREAALCAADAGFAIRLRSRTPLNAEALGLALSAGAISIVAPMDAHAEYRNPLAAIGCVRAIPATEGFSEALSSASHIRKAIDDGASIALASSFRPRENGSFNMQFLLHLAVSRLGMTAEEAIVATTYNAVCSLRLSHATGSIEPGKSADLLMMEVADYRDLPRRAGHHDVSMVMRAGQLVSRRSPLIPD